MLGLKASPKTAIFFPFTLPPTACLILSTIFSFWFSFAKIADSTTESVLPYCFAIFTRALVSLGKQLPPYPGPACKNLSPMRLSRPMARATSCTLAPAFSHRFAISFMNVIFTAKKAFEAYFIISAVSKLVSMYGVSLRYKARYTSFIKAAALSLSAPITTLSGCVKS